ncbi:hypothetical protein L596_002621 [Steinernema carpocapsae]|uniref:Uncharacterized protein n=1 Tax=Steinernema carpocapsae TaxID=34508 RepID=A0A4U8USN9_STECR|nr:hypothetical protein L596_002621 [Steinernema carpocapsae]
MAVALGSQERFLTVKGSTKCPRDPVACRERGVHLLLPLPKTKLEGLRNSFYTQHENAAFVYPLGWYVSIF